MASNAPEGFALEAAGKPSPSIRVNASLTWHDVPDDFTLCYEGHVVGRIRLAGDASSADSPWEWRVTVPMEMPEWARGSAGSREECFKAFAIALGRFLVEKSPERLERAWDLEQGAEARRSKSSTEKLPARSAVEFEDARPKETIPPPQEEALGAIARALRRLTKDKDNLL
jgi:hypothetical protein